MPFGGGSYINYIKFLPGTYTNTYTVGLPEVRQTRGIVAAGLQLDWGPVDEVFEFTSDDFNAHAVELTGYESFDEHNILIREAFRHATRFVAYRLNGKGSTKASHEKVGEAACSGALGNQITVTCYENANEEGRYDVSTYFNGTIKDIQTVPGVEKVVDRYMTLELKDKSDEDISGNEEIQDVTVEFECKDNKVTGTFSKVPEGYEIYTQLMLGTMICALVPGRIDLETKGTKVTLTLGPDAAYKADYTLKLGLKKTADSKRTIVSSQKITPTLNEEKEFGADCEELDDNDFVVFNDKVIPPEAGYVFEGGRTSGSVTAGNHADMLNAIENRTFNNLICDVEDESVKQLYYEYTKRLRDERGIYFQLVVHDYVDPCYEGVISVYNPVATKGMPECVKRTSAVWWFAGYCSGVELFNELTSKPYDGELSIIANYPVVQMEGLKKKGHVVFHTVGIDEIYTLFDINTLTKFTKDHGHELSENKVMRIVDFIHNEEAYQINRGHVGTTPNTPEGRTAIWNVCCSILNELQNQSAISDFVEEELTVDPIPGNKHAVKIEQRFRVVGTIYYVYISTYVVE